MFFVLLTSLLAATSAGKPRLAFLELANGPEVSREVAQSAGELLVVALSDAGKFDVITDVNHAQVGRRLAQPISSDAALPQALRDAVARLTGEVVPDAGPVDACSSPPCAKEAIAACRHWWEKEWDALTIVGIIPSGPYEQFLHEKTPSRSFPLLVRTRARNGARSEYFASVRFKRVEGDWCFDEAGMRHLRELPIVPDETALRKLLADGFRAAHPGSQVLKLASDRYPDYERATAEAPASWTYRLDVTYAAAAKTQICPRAAARLVKAGKVRKYQHESDGNCDEVLDAAAGN